MTTYFLWGMIVGLAAIVFLFLYLNLRDTPNNNLARARQHHRLAESYYKDGRHEDADDHYAHAKKYREKAEKQMRAK